MSDYYPVYYFDDGHTTINSQRPAPNGLGPSGESWIGAPVFGNANVFSVAPWAEDTAPMDESWNVTRYSVELEEKNREKNRKKQQIADLLASEAAATRQNSIDPSSTQSTQSQTIINTHAATGTLTEATTKTTKSKKMAWNLLTPVWFEMPTIDQSIRSGDAAEWIALIKVKHKKPDLEPYEFAEPPNFAPDESQRRDMLTKAFRHVQEHLIPEHKQLHAALVKLGVVARTAENVVAMFDQPFDLSRPFSKEQAKIVNRMSDEEVKKNNGLFRKIQIELIRDITSMRRKEAEINYLKTHPGRSIPNTRTTTMGSHQSSWLSDDGKLSQLGPISTGESCLTPGLLEVPNSVSVLSFSTSVTATPAETDDFESIWGNASSVAGRASSDMVQNGEMGDDLIDF
jgi:hypothetical protein